MPIKSNTTNTNTYYTKITTQNPKNYLRPKLMSNLSIRGRRNKHSMTRPPLINLEQCDIILSNDKHFLMMLLLHNTNQPIIQKGQVRLTHCTNNDSPISPHKSYSLRKCVSPPLRLKNLGIWIKERRGYCSRNVRE